MNHRKRLFLALSVACVFAAGCGQRDGTENSDAADAPTEAAEPGAADGTATGVPGDVPAVAATADDAARIDALVAGLAVMNARVADRNGPVLPVDVQAENRYMLHPADDAEAWIEFDVTGIDSLVVDAVMRDVSASADCAGNPDAATVDLHWSLDGGEATVVRVDRSAPQTLTISPEGASRLRIAGATGNDVNWCDWLLVGVRDIAQ